MVNEKLPFAAAGTGVAVGEAVAVGSTDTDAVVAVIAGATAVGRAVGATAVGLFWGVQLTSDPKSRQVSSTRA